MTVSSYSYRCFTEDLLNMLSTFCNGSEFLWGKNDF